MKINIKNKLTGLIIGIALLTGFTGCKEDVDLQLPYLFRPVNFNVELLKTEATFSWAVVDSAVSYTLQVSTDSAEFSNLLLDTTVTNNSFVKEFAGETQFYARIRANASTETKNSKFNVIAFETPKENILLPDKILLNAQKTVQVSWEPGKNVTHLELETSGNPIESFTITADEAIAGTKTCLVANNNASYNIRIYNGSILRGSSKITVEGDVFLTTGGSLKNAIETATGSKFVIILQAGDYAVSSANICPAGTSLIIKGADKTNHAKVSVQANSVVLSLPTTADSIIMSNIDFTATTAGNTAYFINQSVAANVGKLKFDGCKITGFGNNILRFQAAGDKRISNFIVNNTIVSNCGNGAAAMPSNGTYAFVNSNIDNGFITNIQITNSTFNGVSHSLLNVSGTSGSTTTNIVSSISIVNSTFYNIVGGSTSTRYLIDGGASTNNATIDITLKNLIFAKTMATNIPGGIRKAAGILDVQNVYTTSDWNTTVIIPGALSYSGSSTDLWVDPANGDFKLKATTFPGKGVAGDLRWY